MAVPLPYERATSGKLALRQIEAVLRGFGASSFGVMEHFDAGEVVVQFVWREYRVTFKASIKGYSAAWLREHPWSRRMKVDQATHERFAVQKAAIAVYSILRDWIKGQITAIQTGLLSFEAAFLSQIMLPTGETVLERIQRTDMLALATPPGGQDAATAA